MVNVITRITRAEPADIERLGQFTAATIHEAQGRRGAIASHIKPIDPETSFVGSACTVVCAPRDNLMLQIAIHYAQPGDVLVVAAGEYSEAGMFGDVLGNACKSKGIAALVTDAGVRDTRELRELGLPVFSGSVSIKGTVKETLGSINHEIVFGGELIRPGDIIKGDADGVVLVRREEVAEVAELSARRDEHEAELIRKYWAGGTTIELCNLTEVLRSKGLTSDIDAVVL
ncbi:4-carboxy-4-hydroxy-2-oxoadipate aldolase/oxaloacetate decarboxylase [Microbacterium sp.]|uniref:4-carboxy-4-hydroxy-2-oxoadipate aldolase/oxaloacetate decarboxylase n=1 Tax=Microbacterium sp. TaxID=51671 RepID=UPI003C70B8F0